jgi:hypothetical protein
MHSDPLGGGWSLVGGGPHHGPNSCKCNASQTALDDTVGAAWAGKFEEHRDRFVN